VSVPLSYIYIRMAGDNDEVTDLNCNNKAPSQEECDVLSSPDITLTTPRRSPRMHSPPTSVSSQRQNTTKRVLPTEESLDQRQIRRVRKDGTHSVTCSTIGKDSTSSEEDKNTEAEESNLVFIKREKSFVKLSKRKVKKGQTSPIWM
jgi:hypothetical protein